MYIALKNINKNMGKFIEIQDLYIGLPILFLFLFIFSFTQFKLFAIIIATTGAFLMLPINFSKKNRMYKIIYILIRYLIRTKEYTYFIDN